MREPWESPELPAVTPVDDVSAFLRQQIAPLFFRATTADENVYKTRSILSEEEFWKQSAFLFSSPIELREFKVSDWFPRTPGVFWTDSALYARNEVWAKFVIGL